MFFNKISYMKQQIIQTGSTKSHSRSRKNMSLDFFKS